MPDRDHEIPQFTDVEKDAARLYMREHPEEFGPRDWPDPLMAPVFWRLDTVSRDRFRNNWEPYPPLPPKAVSVLSRMFASTGDDRAEREAERRARPPEYWAEVRRLADLGPPWGGR